LSGRTKALFFKPISQLDGETLSGASTYNALINASVEIFILPPNLYFILSIYYKVYLLYFYKLFLCKGSNTYYETNLFWYVILLSLLASSILVALSSLFINRV
jgi:hypothetical protein